MGLPIMWLNSQKRSDQGQLRSMCKQDLHSLLKGMRVLQQDSVPELHQDKGSLEARKPVLHEDMQLLLETNLLVILSTTRSV